MDVALTRRECRGEASLLSGRPPNHGCARSGRRPCQPRQITALELASSPRAGESAKRHRQRASSRGRTSACRGVQHLLEPRDAFLIGDGVATRALSWVVACHLEELARSSCGDCPTAVVVSGAVDAPPPSEAVAWLDLGAPPSDPQPTASNETASTGRSAPSRIRQAQVAGRVTPPENRDVSPREPRRLTPRTATSRPEIRDVSPREPRRLAPKSATSRLRRWRRGPRRRRRTPRGAGRRRSTAAAGSGRRCRRCRR